jgi:hypothetical protein
MGSCAVRWGAGNTFINILIPKITFLRSSFTLSCIPNIQEREHISSLGD